MEPRLRTLPQKHPSFCDFTNRTLILGLQAILLLKSPYMVEIVVIARAKGVLFVQPPRLTLAPLMIIFTGQASPSRTGVAGLHR
ncbi:hypothetical protein KFK09_016625 [Dendrobium nobile]|uniref:Uncharacterized protein n=1 Tax=Dendrobium nobile TaxID=94219 RepID=A0A8T3B006_DENNO|nr:hypothetical protein KFK09_016625 [Dendrobium nobile]